jgi:membrane protease YdiL (CAAX protease family)
MKQCTNKSDNFWLIFQGLSFYIIGLFAIYYLGLSALPAVFASTISLRLHHKALEEGDDSKYWYFLLAMLIGCYFLGPVDDILSGLLSLLFPLSVFSRRIAMYLFSNMHFAFYTGLYIVFELLSREGGNVFANIFSKNKKVNFRDFFSGYASQIALCCLSLFGCMIYMTVPLYTFLIVVPLTMAITGIQALFEELTCRMAPLKYFTYCADVLHANKNYCIMGFMIVSSIFFGLMHTQYVQQGLFSSSFLSVCIGGLLYGLISYNSSGIEFSTGAHTAWNSFIYMFNDNSLFPMQICRDNGINRLYIESAVAANFFLPRYKQSSKDKSEEKDIPLAAKHNAAVTPQ